LFTEPGSGRCGLSAVTIGLLIELVNFSARTGLPEVNNGYVCLAIDDP
jgi:hypothetical protein